MSGIIVTVALYVLSIIAAFLGLLVLLRNGQQRTQRFFVMISFSCALWIASNALYGEVADDLAYPVALFSYAFAAAGAVSFFGFVADITGVATARWKWVIWTGLAYIVLSAVPGVLATNIIDKNIQTTPLIAVYALLLGALFVAGIGILFRALRHSRGLRRYQLRTVLAGLALMIVGGVFFNLVLPLMGNYHLVQLGPAFSVCFVAAGAYAIIRHRLFDVRAAVLRVVAYVLSVVSVATLYVIVAFVVATPLVGSVQASLDTQLIYIGLAILSALTFQPLKRFFDTATRAIFYKDAYDTQQLVDDLGTLLVREVDVSKLVKHSLQLLANAIKPASSEIVLLKNHVQAREITLGKPFKGAEALITAIRSRHVGLVITDELASAGGPLYQLLTTSDVAIATPLVTSNATVGYLLVGYKASGDAFTRQDIDLVHIFADELAVAVQNALRFEEISRFNVTLKEEVDDATGQLRESNRKLHKLDEAKDEFISMASHQLRTPLTSVKGYLSMVLEGDAGNITKDQRKLLEEAYSSSQRMVYLIGDFLNVSRLQTGKFVLETTQVNLAHLVQEEVEQLQATAARRGIRLEYHQPSEFPDIAMDDGKIRQVIMNFIDNAVYYSKPNSSVMIELTVGLRDVTLAVHDTGIGVPVSERHRLFTKFYRATNARRVRPDGTGIGLYMAKKVIAAHGGSVIFETKENKGSTFGFKLPLK